MKKKIIVLLSSLFVMPVMADSWDDFSNVDRMWDGQKSITNQEFEQVMEKLEENDKKKEERKEKKRIKKIFGGGKVLHSEKFSGENTSEVNVADTREEGILINIPVKLKIDNVILDKGYYKVFAEREENKIFVSFYQSQFFKGKIEVIETEDDFGQENLDFAEIIHYNDQFVKLIFGSIDFNAYVLIPFSE